MPKQTAAKTEPVEQKTEAVEVQAVETIEAAEAPQPEGVTTVDAQPDGEGQGEGEGDQPTTEQPQPEGVVATHDVKINGKRYRPGDVIPNTEG